MRILACVVAAAAVLAASPVEAGKLPRCFGDKATIIGTDVGESEFGTAGKDVIVMRGGNDAVLAGEGRDRVCGGSGNDALGGGPGNDRLFGGTGDDSLLGSEGIDRAKGYTGADSCDAEIEKGCEA